MAFWTLILAGPVTLVFLYGSLVRSIVPAIITLFHWSRYQCVDWKLAAASLPPDKARLSEFKVTQRRKSHLVVVNKP